jgi:hypothetical protein
LDSLYFKNEIILKTNQSNSTMPNQKKLVTKPIELATAQAYFSLFEDKGCIPLFNNFIGGVFHAETMKDWIKSKEFNGIFFWYCLDNGQVSLAAEYKPGFIYEEDKIESYWPDSANQIIESTNYIMSSGEKIWYPFQSEAEFSEDVLKATSSDLKSVGDIGKKVNDFMIKMDGKDLCIVGFGYMDNKDGKEFGLPFLSAFLSREELVYISYHFGYKDSEDPEETHHLQLVLIGRGADGKPLKNLNFSLLYSFEVLNDTRPPKKPPTT